MIKRSEKEIRALYVELINESAVAKKLGVSRQSMYDYRIRHDIKYDPGKAKEKRHTEIYADRNAKIIDAYLAGIPMDKICARFNMNKPAINYILIKYKAKKPVIHPSLKRNMEIYKLRQRGTSIKELAERYDLTPQYVSTMVYKIKKRETEESKK